MSHLRQYIRNILKERLNFDRLHNLALYEGNWGGSKLYFLYAIDFIKEVSDANSPTGEMASYSLGQKSENLYGMISLTEPSQGCNGAMIVELSRAKDGWGPTMYDIAMSLHPDGIISDRVTVSSEAFRLWKYYKERRSDVNAYPLDHYTEEYTEYEGDDCPPGSDGDYLPDDFDYGRRQEDWLEDPLSWSYSREPIPEIHTLKKNHEFAQDLAFDYDLELTEEFWIKAARGFFNSHDEV